MQYWKQAAKQQQHNKDWSNIFIKRELHSWNAETCEHGIQGPLCSFESHFLTKVE